MTMAACGGALIIAAEFKAADYLKLAARERVTYTVLVPAMYNLCLLQPDFDSYDLSSWRIGGFGGAPMPIATIERLATKLPGLKLMNCYGATETTSPSTIMPGELTADYIDSVGLPCPGATIIAVDAEGQRAAARRDRRDSGSTARPSSRATGTIRKRPPKASPAASGIPAISARSMPTISCACSTARRT